MKMLLSFAATLLLGAMGLFAADQSWTGQISDSMCGASHPAGEHGGKAMTAKQCTTGCVKMGAKYIFVSEGKVYKISNQDAAGLAKAAGDNVKVTGTMSGDTVTVKKISKAS
jgi:hypothetical protein